MPRSCHLTDTLTYTHSLTYTHINTYTLTYTHKLTHMHTHTQINTCIHTVTHRNTHTYRRGFKEYGIKCRFSGLKVKFKLSTLLGYVRGLQHGPFQSLISTQGLPQLQRDVTMDFVLSYSWGMTERPAFTHPSGVLLSNYLSDSSHTKHGILWPHSHVQKSSLVKVPATAVNRFRVFPDNPSGRRARSLEGEGLSLQPLFFFWTCSVIPQAFSRASRFASATFPEIKAF